jgi:hypothetical protein
LYLHSAKSFYKLIKSTIVKSEQVVVAEESHWSTRLEVEDLSKLNWIFTVINVEISWNKGDNTTVDWWLSIETFNIMFDLCKTREFFNNWRNPLKLLTFKTEHRMFCVEIFQTLKIEKLKLTWKRKRIIRWGLWYLSKQMVEYFDDSKDRFWYIYLQLYWYQM